MCVFLFEMLLRNTIMIMFASCQGIAQSRGLTPKAVMAAIDEAPLPAARAVALRLLDATKYR